MSENCFHFCPLSVDGVNNAQIATSTTTTTSASNTIAETPLSSSSSPLPSASQPPLSTITTTSSSSSLLPSSLSSSSLSLSSSPSSVPSSSSSLPSTSSSPLPSSSLSSSSSSSSSVPTAFSSTPADNPSTPSIPNSLIIIMPVLIVLFVLTVLIITIYLRRKRRRSRLYGSSGSIFVGPSNKGGRSSTLLSTLMSNKTGNNRVSRLGSKDSLPTPPPIHIPGDVQEKRGNSHRRASTVLQFEAMHPHVVLVNEDDSPVGSIIVGMDGRNQECRMIKVLQIDESAKKKECWWKMR